MSSQTSLDYPFLAIEEIPTMPEYQIPEIKLFKESKKVIKDAVENAVPEIRNSLEQNFSLNQVSLSSKAESGKKRLKSLEAAIRQTVRDLFEDKDFFSSDQLFEYLNQQLLNESQTGILDGVIDTTFIAMAFYSRTEREYLSSNLEDLCLSGVLSDISQILFSDEVGVQLENHPEMSCSICKELGVRKDILEPISFHHFIDENFAQTWVISSLQKNSQYLIFANAYAQAFKFYKTPEVTFKFLKYLSLKGHLNISFLDNIIKSNLSYENSTGIKRLFDRYSRFKCTNGVPESLLLNSPVINAEEPILCAKKDCKGIVKSQVGLSLSQVPVFSQMGISEHFGAREYRECSSLNI